MARVELNIVALGNFTSVNAELKALQAQINNLQKSLAGVGVSSSLTKDLNSINAAFKQTMLSTGQFTLTTVKMQAETEKFGHALVNGKLKLNDYYNIIKMRSSEAVTQMKALAVEQTKLQNSVMITDPTKPGLLSVYTPKQIDKVANATRIAANEANLYAIAVNKGSQSLINWGKNTQWAGRQLTVGMSVPLLMFGSKATQVFKDVTTEIVRLQKVYGTGLQQPTQQALKDIKKQTLGLARELAGSMGVAAKDTAAMAADLAATGKTGVDLISATREAIRLAKLGELDQQSAMQATVSLQNVYKLSTEELSGAIDFLNAVENQTSTSLKDLTEGIPRVGPIVKQLGGSFKDTAIMMVAMKEAGVPAAQSANAIKSAIASMINPTKAAKDAFAEYNISLAGISANAKGNPIEMFKGLQEALKNLEPLAQSQLINKIFGKYQQARIQALITNLGATNSQTKTAFELMSANSSQLSDLAAKEMKTATDSSTGRYQRALETFKADLLPVGEKILDLGTKLLSFGNAVAKVFEGLPGPVKTLMGALAVGVALAGPIIMLTGLMGNFVGFLIRGIFNIKQLASGGKTLGQLLTPELIAAQNAAAVFGGAIGKDITDVELFAKAIQDLTRSINGMNMALNAGTGMGSVIPKVETVVASRAMNYKQMRLPGFAGGLVPGTGPGDVDSFPAMLAPGEAVIPAKATRKFLPFIQGMIKGTLPGYVFGHAAMPFGEETDQYKEMMAKYPSLVALEKEYPGSVRVVSNLGNTSMSQKLNSQLRSGTATQEAFASGFGTGDGLGFAKSAGLGGLEGTPETTRALKEFEAEIKKRVLTLNKITITDEDLAKETRKLIDEQKHATTATGKVAKALDRSSQQVGQVRVNPGADYIREGVVSGRLKKNGTLVYLNESPVGQIRNKGGRVTDYAINQSGSYQSSMAVQMQAKALGEQSIRSLKASVKAASPSKLAEEVGKNVDQGYAKGMQMELPLVMNAAKDVGRTIEQATPELVRTAQVTGAKVSNALDNSLVETSRRNSGRLRSMLTSKMSISGGVMAMGMMGSMVPGGVGSALGTAGSLAGMAGMLSPAAFANPIMAGVAGLSLAYAGISKLIAINKDHAAQAKAQWQISETAVAKYKDQIDKTDDSLIQTLQDLNKIPNSKTVTVKINQIGGGNTQSGKDKAYSDKEILSEYKRLEGTLEKNPDSTEAKQYKYLKDKGRSSSDIKNYAVNMASTMISKGISQKDAADSVIKTLLSAGQGNIASTFSNDTSKITQGNALQRVIDSGIGKYGRNNLRENEANIKNGAAPFLQIDTFNNIRKILAPNSNQGVEQSLKVLASAKTPIAKVKQLLDGLSKSSLNSTGAMVAVAAELKRAGGPASDFGKQLERLNKYKLADAMKALRAEITLQALAASGNKEAISLMADATDKAKKANQTLVEYIAAHPEIFKSYVTTNIPGITKPDIPVTPKTPLSADEIIARLQKQYSKTVDQANARLKTEEKTLAVMDNQNNAAKTALDYSTQQTDIANQIKQKIATGDLLGANLLRQQMYAKTNDYNMQVTSNKNRNLLDKGRSAVADLQDQIAQGKAPTKSQLKAIADIQKLKLGTYSYGNLSTPAASSYGTTTALGATGMQAPSINITVNGSNLTQEQLTAATTAAALNAYKQLGIKTAQSGTKTKVGK